MSIELAPDGKPLTLPETTKRSHLQLFESLDQLNDSVKPIEKSLLILATPRSGSTLFCEALNNTGLIGLCDEWLNYEYFSAWAAVTGAIFSLQDYLTWLSRKTTRNTGVFCLKLHIGQLVALNEDYKIGIEVMDFDNIVYVYRRNKLAQAVSLAKAVSTNQFRSYEIPCGEPNISRTAIADGLKTITQHDEFARKYLWKYIDASYAYEDFVDLRFDGYPAVINAMGKDPFHAGGFKVERLKRQSDETNKAAIKDFNHYLLGEIE